MTHTPSAERLPRAAVLAAATGIVLLLAGAAGAAPGDLDPSFGTAGRVTTDLGGITDEAHALIVQADGRIVAGGFRSGPTLDLALVRYDSSGALDPTFDGDGMAFLSIPNDNGGVNGLALQPDGKIVAVASSFAGNIALARLNQDGSPDTTFGSGGMVVAAVPGRSYTYAYEVALASDGKIVVAGLVDAPGGQDLAVLRFNADGSTDVGFGSGGAVVVDRGPTDQAHALGVQPDGKIVAAGFTFEGLNPVDFMLVRLNPDGSPDGGFGNAGVVITDFGPPGSPSGDVAEALVLQPDGKIVAGGTSSPQGASPTGSMFALARYHADGTLDAGFGALGLVRAEIAAPVYRDDQAYALVRQGDGKLVAGGASVAYPNPPYPSGDFGIARFLPNGSLDVGFGSGGTLLTDFGADDNGRALALEPDGDIVAAGYRSTSFTTGEGTTFALARYLGGPPASGDATPPTVTCKARPARLWPPNHKLVAVTTRVTVKDTGSGSAGFTLVSVTSSEADSGLLPYDVPDDIQGWEAGEADTEGLLRAEHAGQRVYSLTYEGRDRAGNAARCTIEIAVAP